MLPFNNSGRESRLFILHLTTNLEWQQTLSVTTRNTEAAQCPALLAVPDNAPLTARTAMRWVFKDWSHNSQVDIR